MSRPVKAGELAAGGRAVATEEGLVSRTLI